MQPTRWSRRFALALVGLAHVIVALAVLSSPAAAQSVNRAAIDELNTQLLYVALPLTLFVELTLLYAIYRFRNNDDPKPTVDDPALEITWTSATAVILVFVGISGFFVMANPYLSPESTASAATPQGADTGDELVVEVLAYQWGWEVHYPESGVTTQGEIVIPKDRDVRFVLKSEDVVHSFYVPKLGIKQDVFPGEKTVALTRATETGEHRLYCAELCGNGHTKMQGTVVVLDQSAYSEWESSDGNQSTTPDTPTPTATPGM